MGYLGKLYKFLRKNSFYSSEYIVSEFESFIKA